VLERSETCLCFDVMITEGTEQSDPTFTFRGLPRGEPWPSNEPADQLHEFPASYGSPIRSRADRRLSWCTEAIAIRLAVSAVLAMRPSPNSERLAIRLALFRVYRGPVLETWGQKI